MPVWLEIEIAMIVVLAPLLGWLITKFASLNNRVSKLEIHRLDNQVSLERIEGKIDKLTDRFGDKVGTMDVRLARVETKLEVEDKDG